MHITWHSARNVGHAQEIVTAHAMSSSSVKLQQVPTVWDEVHISRTHFSSLWDQAPLPSCPSPR